MEEDTQAAATLAADHRACWSGGWVGLLLLGSAVVGCGSSGPRLEAVDGSVLLDGEPVAGATVTFVPAAGGLLATAITSTDGGFTMLTQVPGQGAQPGVVAGDYAVTIVKVERPAGEDVPENDPSYIAPTNESRPRQPTYLVPAGYGEQERSGLSATIVSGGNKVTFELDSKGPKDAS